MVQPHSTDCFAEAARCRAGGQPDEPLPSHRAARVLLIDDDQSVSSAQIRRLFASAGHEFTTVQTGALGIDHIRRSAPDVVLLEQRLPDQAGLAVHEAIRALDARIPVIFLTSESSADATIQAMRQGAFEYLRKPLDLPRLQAAMEGALDVVQRRHLASVPSGAEGAGTAEAFVGQSDAMLEAYKAIGLVSSLNVPVLITGETGTGKDVAARAVHAHSARASRRFLALNCAAIPENLLESELFGHERGAFTGADRRQLGKFEQCDGGTLLLDEIGDMPLSLQAKILRVLQEQSFQRLGGSETIHTNVRVIAATHRDLRALVAEGRFRADLYYRLAVCAIRLPPLRERGDDLSLLAHHFLGCYSRELGRDVRLIAPEAMARLRAYHWPGNVRELQSVLKQALLRASGLVLVPAVLPDLHASAPASERSTFGSPSERATVASTLDDIIDLHLNPEMNDLYAVIHEEVDRQLFTRVLDFTNGNQRQAARVLGVARATLRKKFRDLALRITHEVAERGRAAP
jgi:two-component system nitrogen regulation response regulator GlnG